MLPAADRAVGLQLDRVLESSVEHRLLGPAPESVVHWEGGGTPGVCIPTQFPGDAGAVVRRPHFENHQNRVPLPSRETTSHLTLPIRT